MALDVRVEAARCIGSGSCVNNAPGTFLLDRSIMVAEVVDPEGDAEDDVVRAAEACPTGAISVHRDGVRLI
jgi:ferredoxin